MATGPARKGLLVATFSTLLVAGAVAYTVGSSPAWPEVQKAFFDGRYFSTSLPAVAEAFTINVRLFIIAELLILDRKSTRLNSSHTDISRMPSSA